METPEQTTLPLRDTISAAFEAEEAKTTQLPTPEAAAVTSPDAQTPAEADAPKPDDRPRDASGKFIEKPKDAPQATDKVQAPAAPAAPAKPHPTRPSSWKKDYWEDWNKIDPRVAEYIGQRESEFAKGVSTYKTEFDRAKPLLDALTPYQDDYKRAGIDPAQQIARYAEIHRNLSLGNPEQRLSTFLQIAQQYAVQIQNLLIKGNDGQVYWNQQYQQQQQAQTPQAVQPDVAKLVDQRFAQMQAQQATKDFIGAKDASGNPLHPHYETVRETMAQLLEAGLADDIPSAYEAALRHPKHAEIFDALQQQQAATKEAERVKAAKEEAERARRNTVSPKTATPAGNTGSAKKGLRATLEAAYDEQVAGRV